MKSARADVREPERWIDRAAGSATAEGAAGAALRRARDATEPREEHLARLQARLAAPRVEGSSRQWRWRLALALALLLATGGAVGAAGKLLRRLRSAPSAPSVSAGPDVSADGHSRARTGRGLRERAPAAPAIPSTPGTETSASEVAASPRVSDGAPTPPSESPVAQAVTPHLAFVDHPAAGRRESSRPLTEARLLGGAFRALRAEQDPDAALRALDRYDREFPRGALVAEARIARVEALMTLGRRADALALLVASDGGGGTPTRNVLVVRGELFAEAGQCGKAIGDFDRILAAAARDDAEARALFGRAACRLRGGDVAAAERDLRRYLERHPTGAFAAAARQALHEAP